MPFTRSQQVTRSHDQSKQLQAEQLEQRELMAALAYDFGPLGKPVAAGAVAHALELYGAANGAGWTSVSNGSWLMTASRNIADPMNRDFVFGSDATFKVDLPNGTYDVSPTLGDSGLVRDKVGLWLEGSQVATNLTTQAGEFIRPTYRVTVKDGQLNFRIADGGGANGNFALAGLTIAPAGTTPPKTPGAPNSTNGSGAAWPTTAPSPTGSTPSLLWTTQQQAVWNRMRGENDPWWQLIRDNADRTATKSQRYGDYGQWAVLAYQVTGDRTYAAKAWAAIQPVITAGPTSANQVRQYFMSYAQFYDWLKPALTESQKSTYVAGLNTWAKWSLAINTPVYKGGFRVTDSDQTIGQYFGLAFTDLVTGSHWLDQVSQDATGTPVGGLVATGVNMATARNAISHYARLAAGGEFIESSSYNINTLQLLLEGVSGVRTATGKDYFPEVTQLIPQIARAQIAALTPDLKDSFSWGDNEHPHELELSVRRTSLLGMLGGLTQNDPTVGLYANQLVKDLVQQYGARGYLSAEPMDAKLFNFYNPYAAVADWRTLSAGYYASGRGTSYFRDGTGANGALFVSDMGNHFGVDHETTYMGDFALYRNGEWAVTRPLGYGATAVSAESANSMMIAGLSTMAQHSAVANEFGANGSYSYSVGTTGGDYYVAPYYQPPAAFLKEWTRSLFYLPSADGKSSTIISFDRVNAKDPRTVAGYDRYRAADRAKIEAAPALAQWTIHAPVAPTVTKNGVSWTTEGGQNVSVSSLSTSAQTIRTYDESVMWAGNTDFTADEKDGYQVRISNQNPGEWQTMLNVVQASTSGTKLVNSLVQSKGGEAQGALVQRGGQPDALVMFGAQAAGRVTTSGYSVSFTAGTATSDVYLADLDPTKQWRVSVNGGAAVNLQVSAAGVGHLVTAGVGKQSVQLIAV
ncbi:Beta-agarase A precursor [Gemmata sp. SH-PL17]|uniref:hypothetical protein n=1 Tax=Gemmata sp. SH-PL17 TaxID=1630693 RepID=UPI0006963893|nr:hypothetical protein [Gemmata sp. SH-PL17]AMV27721.1 Beta-agarase A precursor [Gemmata sp. SH-PL17]